MNISQAEKIAIDKINFHLTGWSFKWNDRKRTLGLCSHQEKAIYLSKTITSVNPEDSVIETIMHEIAHALVGPGHGHDAVWKAKAAEIGCKKLFATGHVCSNDLSALGVKWVLVDVEGNIIKHWFRKPAKTTFAKLPHIYLKGKKEETIGTLAIIPYEPDEK